MSSSSLDTNRIAKNTLMLYFRQIVVLLVSLYTVRLVLNTLGTQDYGIFNLVSGFVVFFAYINNSMATATQRFLNFELGKKDEQKVNKVFNTSLLIHCSIAILFVVLAETIGLWFLRNKLDIPIERKIAAFYVFQATIISTITGIIKVPFESLVVSYEKMSFFAKISIVEVFFKLFNVLFIIKLRVDKLILYSFLVSFANFIIALFYIIFCKKNFSTSHLKFNKDTRLIKSFFSFSSWSLVEATANVCNYQGANIVINKFFGIAVNATIGIANQVNACVYSFVSNFQTAFNPQLIKSYAEEDFVFFKNLINRTAKVSVFLLLYFVVPLMINTEYILTLWLKNVPEYTIEFVQLILIFSLTEAINTPLYKSIAATGKIKLYTIFISIINFSNLPFAIICFCFFKNPVLLIYIRVFLNIIALIYRMFVCKKLFSFSIKTFITNVIFRITIIALICFCSTYFIYTLFSGFLAVVICTLFNIVLLTILVLTIGLTKNEREVVLNKVKGEIKLRLSKGEKIE